MSTLLWVYGIILLIVFIIIAALISAGYNNGTYAGLVKPSSDPGKGGMIIIWLIAFLIIWYAWYQSAKCAPCDRNGTNLNILFGLNLLLVFPSFTPSMSALIFCSSWFDDFTVY